MNSDKATVPWHILPAIVLAQWMGTSIWFAGNAVLPDLQVAWQLSESFGDILGPLTISVQLGFILGTLVFAFRGIADRFSPRLVFVICIVLGAVFNLGAVLIDLLIQAKPLRLALLLLSRFLVGLSLAGIYPVGMRIASGWYQRGLGTALGWLLGALVLGTALPHGMRALGAQCPWQEVVMGVSLVAVCGAILMGFFVPDGPYWVKAAGPRQTINNPWRTILARPALRASVFGYFGHMWELYSFFALCPLILARFLHTGITAGISGLTWMVISAGALFCVLGGYLVPRFGSAKVASALLALSGLCCLLMPWMLTQAPWWLFGLWIFLWGASVSSDSPQFSALNAANAPPDQVGSVLLGANSVGFSISVVSILLSSSMWPWLGLEWMGWFWLPGPLLGLWAMRGLLRSTPR